jgi:carbon-monoxide dehydrogenase medium subunit
VTRYLRPEVLGEAVGLLAEHGDEAKVLAGGQSLVPMMSAGFLDPAVLVDVNHVTGLDLLAVADGQVHVGALVRHRDLELAGPRLARAAPLLPAAAGWIAHEAVRNRGTMAGSLVHADPSAEWPAVALALDATLRLVGPGGERLVAAADFFLGPLTADVEPDELLVEVRLPAAPARTGAAVRELAYRDGDYAVVGVAAQVTLGEAGTLVGVRTALFAVDATPVRVAEAEAVLLDGGLAAVDEAARVAAAGVNPTTDATASEGYRRDMAAVFFARALRAAAAAAAG